VRWREGLLTSINYLYRLATAESSVHCQWDTIILCDDSTFTSANDKLSVSVDLHKQ
jgi:hypothetical protein